MVNASGAGEAKMRLVQPLLIYSRLDLNRMLLERAERAGAAMEKTRVLGIEQRDKGWRLRTRNGTAEADFLVVATGARNPLREVGTKWAIGDTMTTLGYFVPGARERIDIQFLAKFEGYIWVFPRCGHLSVGIAGKGEPAQAMRARLETYMDQQGISRKDAVFYSHMLPSLENPSWSGNRVSGRGWMAVGDAGGLVDPITGEGLYYAIRSGDLASQVVLNDAHDFAGKAPGLPRGFGPRICGRPGVRCHAGAARVPGPLPVPEGPASMVRFMQRSPRFRDLMQDLFAGTQPYLSLRERFMKNLNGTLQEVFMQFFLEHVVPNRPRASS